MFYTPGNFLKDNSRKISIETEILNFKRKYPNQVPIVVFDFTSSTKIVNPLENTIRKWEFLCGGRLNECIYRAKKLFERFKNLGVKLVFFVDGPVKHDKLSTWLQRRNESYEQENNEIFKNIKTNQLNEIKNIRGLLKSYFDNFLNVAKNYGEIITSLQNECDIDICLYATNVNALAIVQDDVDFVFMSFGNWRLWSTRFFDYKTFKTTETNKNDLKRKLNLNGNQLPILAVLWKHFREFNVWGNKQLTDILPKNRWNLKVLSNFINKHFPSGTPLSESELEILCKIIPGTLNRSLNDIKEIVQHHLDFYDCKTKNYSGTLPSWLDKHIKYTDSIIIYQFLYKFPITINHLFIDLSYSNVRSFSDIVIPLVCRQYGIVIYNQKSNDNNNNKVNIYFKSNHTECYKSDDFSPIYPNKDIPNIEDIVSNGNTNNNNNNSINISIKDKFQLLSWIITLNFEKIDHSLLEKCKGTTFLVPCIVLYYLVQEKHFTVEESDIILLSIHKSVEMDSEKSKLEEPPNEINERAFWLSSTYTNIIYFIINSLTICGLYDYIDNNYFDGFIFHKLYLTKNTLNFEPIQEYRIYAN